MNFHWQNLNEDRDGRAKGWPHHGRAWLTVGKVVLRLEWSLWTHFCALAVNARQQENGTSFWFAIPPISVHLAFARESWRSRHEREISIRVFDWAVWWRLWTSPNTSSSETPRWREGSWHFLDSLLGKQRYGQRVLSTHAVRIPMPEGAYVATVELREDTWRRPRWPFIKRLHRCDVGIPEGIPHQGKGENSWDCGEDRLYALTCLASTVEEAIAKAVQSALKSRRRYDGDVMAHYPGPTGPNTGGETHGFQPS